MDNIVRFPNPSHVNDQSAWQVAEAANAFIATAQGLAEDGMSPSDAFTAPIVASARVLTQTTTKEEAERVTAALGPYFEQLVTHMPMDDEPA